MKDIIERIKWVIIEKKGQDAGFIATAVIREIESTHRIVDPEDVTEEMVEACFIALPKHYDPPDMTRRPWHALKARQRFTAMAKAVKRMT